MSLRDKVFPAQGGLPDFVRRFEGAGAGSLGDDETMQHYLEVAPELDGAWYERVAEEAFTRLSDAQRKRLVTHLQQQGRLADVNAEGLHDDEARLREPRRLAALFARMQRDSPDLLVRIAGGAGTTAFGNPIVKIAFATIAALGAKSVLGGYGAVARS